LKVDCLLLFLAVVQVRLKVGSLASSAWSRAEWLGRLVWSTDVLMEHLVLLLARLASLSDVTLRVLLPACSWGVKWTALQQASVRVEPWVAALWSLSSGYD
jgi:hypothetical protein